MHFPIFVSGCKDCPLFWGRDGFFVIYAEASTGLTTTAYYRVRPQDGPQEMERNYATANYVAWPSCAWLLRSFFPFPVGHSVAAHGKAVPE